RYAWSSSDSGYDDTYNVGGDWNTGFGGIDPEFVFDVATGNLMTYTIGSTTCYAVTYGSWKGGIALIYVDKNTLKPICTTAGTSAYNSKAYAVGDVMDAPVDSIDGNQGKKLVGGSGAAYEGAQLIYNSSTGYYYMFVSMGNLELEYRVGVGRSTEIDGTYTDASGNDMASVTIANYHSIGSKISGGAELDGEYGWRCPGGQSILRTRNGKIMLAEHSRTTLMGGDFVLRLHQMFFNSEGWPVLNQNDYYAYYSGYTSSGTESLSALTLSDIAGKYSTILTVRGTDTYSTSTLESDYGFSYKDQSSKPESVNKQDALATESVSMYISADGTIYGDGSSSSYTGTVTLGSNGAATITLKNSSGTALGTFKGYFLHAVDFAKKSSTFSDHRTITFTTLCSDTTATEKGEYFWGNRVSN
ncbi:MAG: family 43 glycosylhydrolase, partial [Spirochaetaceae bacterium]|nr:family 43 glycosylhydrolase [Spirochaetaceae bacterium]